MSRGVLLAVACAALLVGASKPTTASAEIAYIDFWTLTENVSTYGNYRTINLQQRYRWGVDTAHSTRVSLNLCSNYNNYTSMDIPAHSQSYQYFPSLWSSNTCVALRGRSLYGTQANLFGYLLY